MRRTVLVGLVFGLVVIVGYNILGSGRALLWENRRVLRCGHRGFRSRAPENTLASFEEALGAGADCLELDVVLTGDGVVAVAHPKTFDDIVLRHYHVNSSVHLIDFEDARKYDMRIPMQYNKETHLDSFENVLRILMDPKKKTRVVLLIELKPRKDDSDANRLLGKVVDVVDKFACYDRCFLSSYNQEIMKKVKGINNKVHAGYIVGDYNYYPSGVIKLLERECTASCPFDSIFIHYNLLAPDVIWNLQKRNLWIFTWTADEKNVIEYVSTLGVDGIVSNNPDVLSEVFSKR